MSPNARLVIGMETGAVGVVSVTGGNLIMTNSLITLVGGDGKVTPVVEQHRAELQQSRTIKLGKMAPLTGTADFFVLLTPSSGAARIESAKFVTGEEKLKPLTENLRNAKLDFAFPDDVPAKVLRRGTLSCSKDTGQCDFVMTLPEDVHSVD